MNSFILILNSVFLAKISIVYLLLKYILSFSQLKKSRYKNRNLPLRIFFSKYHQIRSFLQIWSHLLRKSLMKSFIFCAVNLVFLVFYFFSRVISFIYHLKCSNFGELIIRFLFLPWIYILRFNLK